MTSHTKLHLTLAGALLALAACGSGTTNAVNEATNAAPANEAAAPANQAAAPAPAATAAPGAVTADYMVGKWSAMGEDCKDTLEFRKDGTMTTPIGDAKWTLNGDKLAIDYGEGSKQPESTIKPLGPDRIEITTSSGRKETEKRC
jgi:hypothetical protein